VISRFGSLDPSEGGDTSRTSVQLGYRVHDDQGGLWRAAVFGLEYRLRLFSDFTLFARDPVHGDEIEQDDGRVVWGLDAAYARHFSLAGMDSYLTTGLQIRDDNAETGLWHAEDRARLADCFDQGVNPCNHTDDRIRDVAGYVEATIHVLPHVHVLPGVRFEQLSWDVDDLNPATRSDLEGAYSPRPWLRFDGNLSIARSSFVRNAGNGNGLALAPRLMGQGGVTVLRGPAFVSLRTRGIADRPGNDDGTLTAQGYLIFDLMTGCRFGKVDLGLTINNLLDTAWREAQFAEASAVVPGGPVIAQMHFTPGIPLSATATAAYRF